MGTIKRYHVNPRTGDVGQCLSAYDKCPFGSLEVHFYDPQEAWEATAKTLQYFHDFTARSVVPQEPDWFTVHVFAAGSNELTGPLISTKPGHRLAIENGWVLEKVDSYSWHMLEAKIADSFAPRIGSLTMEQRFAGPLQRLGGRIENKEGLSPYPIKWFK